jgi:hypothetical protein
MVMNSARLATENYYADEGKQQFTKPTDTKQGGKS